MPEQLFMNWPLSLPKEAYDYGERSSGEMHGVVLTKKHIVNMILDISGYRDTEDLSQSTFLDPSCGHGAFLLPAIQRYFVSLNGYTPNVTELKSRFLAYDIDQEHVTITRRKTAKLLTRNGLKLPEANTLAKMWIRRGDFLLECEQRAFDFIIGNPPYIRIEQLSPMLQTEYRSRYSSLFDRADLYVAFIENGLNLLSRCGRLTYICADRWILNKYGAPLRNKIATNFGVHYYIDLHNVSPFESDVIAYPAIFTMSTRQPEEVQVAKLQSATVEECQNLTEVLLHPQKHANSKDVDKYSTWFKGTESWVLGSPKHLQALRDLESRYEPLEFDGNTKVSIGVATGNDSLYIVPNTLDIEEDRLIPLVKREDISNGVIIDAKRSVINTFVNGQGTVNLDKYPKLKAFFLKHEALIKKRHVAKNNPRNWFRTIDRVYPELVAKPKLLIPDIAGSNEVVFDEGKYYPHHNLYYVTSSVWDMELLGGLLSSRVALFFIWSYAVKMRGNYLRFQAQYLRRICLPKFESLDERLTNNIKTAFRERNFKSLDVLALEAYELNDLPRFDFVDTRK